MTQIWCSTRKARQHGTPSFAQYKGNSKSCQPTLSCPKGSIQSLVAAQSCPTRPVVASPFIMANAVVANLSHCGQPTQCCPCRTTQSANPPCRGSSASLQPTPDSPMVGKPIRVVATPIPDEATISGAKPSWRQSNRDNLNGAEPSQGPGTRGQARRGQARSAQARSGRRGQARRGQARRHQTGWGQDRNGPPTWPGGGDAPKPPNEIILLMRREARLRTYFFS